MPGCNLLLVIGLVLAVSAVPPTLCSSYNQTCPTWLYSSSGEDGWCTCGSSLHGVIICSNKTQDVLILPPFCLTSSKKDSNNAVAGGCLFQWNHGHVGGGRNGLYMEVNRNLTQQDTQLCDYLNRQGQLCGECKSNHFISAYSYDLKCYQCHRGQWSNTALYLTVAFLPLTLFLVAVLVLHISVAHPNVAVAVLLFQVYSLPEILRVTLQNTRGFKFELAVRIMATVYGIWNLDFFRTLIPPLCLHLDTMGVIALDYVVAVYPLLLLVCFYLLVTAHDRGSGVVVRLCRPFLWLSARIRQQWNLRLSIIDAFATFLLLSYIKFINTSIGLLTPTPIYNISGSHVETFLYYDGTVEFMGPRHQPYAVLAIAVLIVGFMFPLLLVLYPMKWFQVCLNKCHLNSPSLRMFIECFQGYYRDRTDGGWDCRYFSAVYPFFRLGVSIIYVLTRNNIFLPIIIVVVICLTATLIVVAPYKKQYKLHNKLDAVLLLSAVGLGAGQVIYGFSFDWYQSPKMGIVLEVIFALFPFVYTIFILLKKTKWALLRLKDRIVGTFRKFEDTKMAHPLLFSAKNP